MKLSDFLDGLEAEALQTEQHHDLAGADFYRRAQPQRVAEIAGMFALPEVKPLNTTAGKKGGKAAA